MDRASFVVLPRLLPLPDGQLLVYGDRGVLFGEGSPDELMAEHGLRHLERATSRRPTLLTVNVFDREGAAYSANALVVLDVDTGWMFGLVGQGFYRVMETEMPALYRALGCRELRAYVMPGHARLMARALRRVGKVDVIGEGEMNGHHMQWVLIKPSS